MTRLGIISDDFTGAPDVAVRVVRRPATARVIIEGGDTSGAETSAFGAKRLGIAGEIAPNVPICITKRHGRGIALILKSGSFDGQDVFAQSLRQLERGR